ncbi:hypothetical protein MalM25_31440 [Planctomycetes bacterium MalM25]|nr:hypothetical protein MalM25_31440 [Planctomycetes bacterium MalM25]
MQSKRFRFRLGTLFVCVTLLCLWLGYQMRWVHQRREALVWIREHETAEKWSSADPTGVTVTPVGGLPAPYESRRPPLAVWLLGEQQVHFITLDRAKVTASDFDMLNRLQALFPETDGVHIEEPGWSNRWTLETHAEIFVRESGGPGR